MSFKELSRCILCQQLPRYTLKIINAADYLIENENAEIFQQPSAEYGNILLREAEIGCKKCKKTILMMDSDRSFDEMFEALKNSWNDVCASEDNIFWELQKSTE